MAWLRIIKCENSLYQIRKIEDQEDILSFGVNGVPSHYSWLLTFFPIQRLERILTLCHQTLTT